MGLTTTTPDGALGSAVGLNPRRARRLSIASTLGGVTLALREDNNRVALLVLLAATRSYRLTVLGLALEGVVRAYRRLR